MVHMLKTMISSQKTMLRCSNVSESTAPASAMMQ